MRIYQITHACGMTLGKGTRDDGNDKQLSAVKPEVRARGKEDGQLVWLGFDVTAFAPATYQRRSLRRPCEI